MAAALAPARRAEPEEFPALAKMLARAFHDDPVLSWVSPPQALRPGVLESFFGARLRHLGPEQEIWTTPELTSAALWAPPERWKTTTAQDLEIARGAFRWRLLPRLPIVTVGLLGVERRHPETPPHWYLAVLGTDPPSQGSGLGSTLLAPVLEDCDRDGVAAYLESSKERNIAFYARHGFRVTGEVQLPGRRPRGPKVWQMWRDPVG